MATIKVVINPQTDNPETTMKDVVNTASSNSPHAVADVIRDYAGRAVEVRLSLPEGVADVTRQAINERGRGISTVSPVFVQQVVMRNLENIELSASLSSQTIMVFAMVPGVEPVVVGSLSDPGGYIDGSTVDNAVPIAVGFANNNTESEFVVSPDSVSLYFDGQTSFVLHNVASITVETSGIFRSAKIYYVDINGKLYLAWSQNSNGAIFGPLSYEQAVILGSV